MKKKIKTVIKILSFIILIIIFYMQIKGVWDNEAIRDDPYFTTDNPFVLKDGTITIAHRFAAGLYPENTLTGAMALNEDVKAGKFAVDTVELDVWLTKDNQLLVMHDATLDRTTDSKDVFGISGAKPCDYTFEELSKLNFAKNFKDENGENPFQTAKASTLAQILEYLEANAHYNYILEVKDSGESGIRAVDEVIKLVEKYKLEDRTLLASFNSEVLTRVDEVAPKLYRIASIGESIEIFLSYLLCKNPESYEHNYEVLSIPTRMGAITTASKFGRNWGLFNLGSQGFINYAHRCGIALYFWTINDERTMQTLIDRNADGIITNYPNRIPTN